MNKHTIIVIIEMIAEFLFKVALLVMFWTFLAERGFHPALVWVGAYGWILWASKPITDQFQEWEWIK